METVSIITPTMDREKHLRLLYECIKKQEGPWEWLICDSSFRPSPFFSKLKDSRVSYFYDEKNLSIGAKRNFLKNQAQGHYITHFDDDDYYAPQYLSRVRNELTKADFFKLTAFFCYSLMAKEIFYWDTTRLDSVSYLLSPTSGRKIREIHFPKHPEVKKMSLRCHKYAFGFSYSYRKKVAETLDFKNINGGEDYNYINKAIKNKFKIALAPDKEGLSLHVIHDLNTSSSQPQYRIPHFFCQKIFPEASRFLRNYPKLIL